MSIKTNVQKLREKDLYSLIMYAIYKCTGEPRYSTLSELIYTLDRESLLKFCAVFGGTTIKVPTIDELKIFANGLLVYDLVSKGSTVSAAWSATGLDSKYKKDVLKAYSTILDVMKDYE